MSMIDGQRRAKRAYYAMLRRTASPAGTADHAYYAQRGITVCQRWQDDIANFLEDMGLCPVKGSINRIDNDKGYEPQNCHWTTSAFQSQNRGCVKLSLDDVYRIHVYASTGHWSCRALGRKYGVHHSTIGYILQGKLYRDILNLFNTHHAVMHGR